MASKPGDLPHNQRNGLNMIAKGFRPRYSTIEALFNRGYLRGSIAAPQLNDAGASYLRSLDKPPSAI